MTSTEGARTIESAAKCSNNDGDLYACGNPGNLIEVPQDDQGVKMGRADFGGIVMQVFADFIP
jgi:hypothetical protein